MARALSKIQSDDPILNRIQDQWIEILNPILRTLPATLSNWTSFTPTLNSTTNVGTNVGRWRRVGDSIEVNVVVKWTGAGAAGTFTVALPNSLSIDDAKSPNALAILGPAVWWDTVKNNIGGTRRNSSTSVLVDIQGATAFASSSAAANHYVDVRFTVPVTGWSASDTA